MRTKLIQMCISHFMMALIIYNCSQYYNSNLCAGVWDNVSKRFHVVSLPLSRVQQISRIVPISTTVFVRI